MISRRGFLIMRIHLAYASFGFGGLKVEKGTWTWAMAKMKNSTKQPTSVNGAVDESLVEPEDAVVVVRLVGQVQGVGRAEDERWVGDVHDELLLSLLLAQGGD